MPKKGSKASSASASDSEKDTKKSTRTATKKSTRNSTKKKTTESKRKAPSNRNEKDVSHSSTSSEPLTVDKGAFDKVLEHMSLSLLKELLEGNNVKKTKSAPKKQCVKDILEVAQKKGQAHLFQSLEKEELKAALTTLDKGELDHDNKSKMLIDLKKHFTDKGQTRFFKELSKDTLVKFAAALEFEEEDADKEDLENALAEEIIIAGLRDVFNIMSKEFIVDAAKSLNVPHTGNKKSVETRILGIAYPHLLDEESDDKKEKGEKKEKTQKVPTDISKINKDSTFEDLYQYYTKDLHDYAEKNALKKTGTKKELIKRILKFLENPSDESVKPQKPGTGNKKKKKSEAQKKREAKLKREEAQKKKAETSGDEGDADKKKDDKKKDDKKKDEKKDDKKDKAASTEEKKDDKKAAEETTEKKGRGRPKSSK